MTDKNNIILKEKAEFYKNEKTIVFIKTKTSLMFNGTIAEVGEISIILNDRYAGRTYISLLEIDRIEPWLKNPLKRKEQK